MSESTTPNPAGILCGNGHRHGSVESVRVCHLGRAAKRQPTWADYAASLPESARPSAPVAPPVVPVPSSATMPAATEAQLDAIRRHGVTPRPGLTRADASAMLDRLIEARNTREAALAHATREPDAEPVMKRTSLGLPAAMLFDIKEGRYAVSLTGTKKLDFIRLSIVKPPKGRARRSYVGCLKVQTQHGESLQTRAYISPEGEVYLVSTTMSENRLTEIFMAIIVDQKKALHLYGREKGMCCRCGKELTDERSRHYGIGPECEKKWPAFVPEMDDRLGEYVPGQLLEG